MVVASNIQCKDTAFHVIEQLVRHVDREVFDTESHPLKEVHDTLTSQLTAMDRNSFHLFPDAKNLCFGRGGLDAFFDSEGEIAKVLGCKPKCIIDLGEDSFDLVAKRLGEGRFVNRSEEHTSELQS